jgi:hypothetical protein
MLKLKYRVPSGSCRIDTLEIIKESDHNIWIKEDQNKKNKGEFSYSSNWKGIERKNTTSNSHFDTWEEAFSFLQLRVIDRLKSAENRLESAKSDFALVAEMEPEK